MNVFFIHGRQLPWGAAEAIGAVITSHDGGSASTRELMAGARQENARRSARALAPDGDVTREA
jgi:hypothetical protein